MKPATRRAAAGDEVVPAGRRVQHVGQRGSEPDAVAHVDEGGRVAEHLGQRTGAGGDDGHAGGHRLERREAEAFVDRRVGEHGRGVQQSGQRPVVDPAGPDDAGVGGGGTDRVSDGVGTPAVGAGEDEGQVGPVGGDVVEGADEAGEVLARLGGADGEDVTGRPGRPVPVGRAGVGRRERRDAGVDGAHAVRIGAEPLDDLAGDEGRRRVHPRAVAQRAADEIRVGERRPVAQLGKADGRQVVDGHHPGGPSGRRDDEVRAVDDVGGADEPFERRPLAVGPSPVQRPRRHGSLADVDTGRDERLDQPTPAPAHREGRDGQVGPVGQAGERAGTEGADTGRSAEQRRHVERHPQGRAGRAVLGHPSSLAHRPEAEEVQALSAPSTERMAPEMYAASSEAR